MSHRMNYHKAIFKITANHLVKRENIAQAKALGASSKTKSLSIEKHWYANATIWGSPLKRKLDFYEKYGEEIPEKRLLHLKIAAHERIKKCTGFLGISLSLKDGQFTRRKRSSLY